MQNLLTLAVEAALDAGRQIMEIYASGDFNVELKGDDSPLTRADVASHHAIMAHLESQVFPCSPRRDVQLYAERAAWSTLIVDALTGPRNSSSATVITVNIIVEGIPTTVVYPPSRSCSSGCQTRPAPRARLEAKTAGPLERGLKRETDSCSHGTALQRRSQPVTCRWAANYIDEPKAVHGSHYLKEFVEAVHVAAGKRTTPFCRPEWTWLGRGVPRG